MESVSWATMSMPRKSGFDGRGVDVRVAEDEADGRVADLLEKMYNSG